MLVVIAHQHDVSLFHVEVAHLGQQVLVDGVRLAEVEAFEFILMLTTFAQFAGSEY